MGPLNEEKYRHAILYFAEHISASKLGKVKLMKLLYYLDFDYFERYHRLVTNDTYRALQMGPVPVAAERTIAGMEAEGWLLVRKVDLGLEHLKHDYIPLRKYDPEVFAATELEVLADVLHKWEHHSKQQIIVASHGEPPWRYTARGGIINPNLVFLRKTEGDTMDDLNQLEGELVMQLTPGQAKLRADGLALAARLEALLAQQPELSAALENAEQQMDNGEYDVVDATGWQLQ